MHHAGKHFYLNLLPVLAILVAAMLVVFIAFSSRLADVYGLQVTDKGYGALEQAMNQLDDRFRNMYNISYLVQQDTQIKKISPYAKVTDRMAATRQLAYYGAVSTFADLIFYFSQNQELVYLPSGSIQRALFLDQQYIYGSHTTKDLMSVLEEDRQITVWPTDTVNITGSRSAEYVTVFIRLNQYLPSANARLGFLIPAASLRALLSSSVSEKGSFAVIRDRDGVPFLTAGELPDAATLPVSVSLPEDGETKLTCLNGTNYYLQSMTSSVSGWRIAAAIPVSAAESGIRSARIYAGLHASILLILCSVIAFLILRHNYKPFMQLVKTAAPDVDVTRKDNEIDVVAHELQRLSRVSEDLHTRLDISRAAALHRLYGRLLHGFSDPETVLRQAKENGLSLAGGFRVAALYLHRAADILPADDEPDRLISAFFGGNMMLYHSENDRCRVSLILPAGPGEDPPEMVFSPLHDRLEEELNLQVAIGVSDPCADFTGIPEAYRQACQALDLRMLRGSSCVCFWEEQTAMDNLLYVYPAREIERLQQYLLQLDPDNTTAVLKEIIELMKTEKMQLSAVRMVCYDIVNTVVKTIGSISRDHVLSDGLLEKTVSFDTVEELTDALEQLIRDLCDSIRGLRDKAMDDRFLMMLEYIRQNAFRADFNVDTMAEHFDLSVSNLSHYFRSRQGQSLSDYVQNLRFTESCRLLRETDDPIQTVCSKTGMLNVSSFIRRFKQLYCMTPGVYRATYRSGSAEGS